MINEDTKKVLRELVPTMNGWLSVDRALEMYDMTCELRPSLVVEIGVFAGRSLISQAMALKDNRYGHIIGIDPWKKEANFEGEHDERAKKWWDENVDIEAIHRECMAAIWKYELDDYVTIIRAASQDCHWLIPNFDIAYIDGNHNEEASCRDVTLYLPKLRQNGYLWMDDCDWPQTQRALKMVDAACVRNRDYGHYRLYTKTLRPAKDE